jgi:hypothetical protein
MKTIRITYEKRLQVDAIHRLRRASGEYIVHRLRRCRESVMGELAAIRGALDMRRALFIVALKSFVKYHVDPETSGKSYDRVLGHV